MMYNNRTPEQEQTNDYHSRQAEPQPSPGRNPRLVVGGLDYFELIMEQEEQA